jgi:lipopolysaccharide biosynthesis glycosyltransferase
MESRAYATFLGSAEFLPGVVALCYSLRQHDARSELIALSAVSLGRCEQKLLNNLGVTVMNVAPVQNPWVQGPAQHRFSSTFSKLCIFDMTSYDKLVYLDADMLVTEDISCLFSKPHMSAVNAGSLIPGNADWTKLNSGLIVVRPDHWLFRDMLGSIRITESPDLSDQGFLQNYYQDWGHDEFLHLEHRFNVPATSLDHYDRHGLSFSFIEEELHIKNISVLHYWGPYKPWTIKLPDKMKGQLSRYYQSLYYWRSIYQKALKSNECSC